MKKYCFTADELALFADALAQLDGPSCPAEWKARIEHGHHALMRALGQDVGLVYGQPDDEIVLPSPEEVTESHLTGWPFASFWILIGVLCLAVDAAVIWTGMHFMRSL